MSITIDEILQRFTGVRQTGSRQWEAKCPAHDDQHASLSIGVGDNGGTLLFCQAKCPTDAVCKAVGLTLADLAPEKPKAKRIVATYDYKDKTGKVIFQTVRFDPKDFKQRRKVDGGWLWGLTAGTYTRHGENWYRSPDGKQFPACERVLYRLPELLESTPDEWVIIVEGEKDADNLIKAGFVATCNPMGAGKWRAEYSECLRGRRVVIIADKDSSDHTQSPGWKHAQSVARSLNTIAAEIRVLELPGNAVKDSSDWLSAGGTADELRKLIAATPAWTPFAPPPDPTAPEPLDPQAPRRCAQAWAKARHMLGDDSIIVYSSDTFYSWKSPCWHQEEGAAIRSCAWDFLDRSTKQIESRGEIVTQPFKPRRKHVDEMIDALKAIAFTRARSPAWLVDDPTLPDPRDLIIARNAIVRLGDPPTVIGPPTPRLFAVNALDYDYAPDAKEPTEWIRFLDTLWPDDPQSIELLQDWFGYVLGHDVSQHKILLVVGPKRSGKGTINRVLTQMIGPINHCGPTLASLTGPFGLQSLLGKQLAVISDARLSGKADQAVVVERLLAISGEDAITIDRKGTTSLNLTLPTRIMIMTNELPRLYDSSGAIASRFLVLTLSQSFYGREDTGLTARLLAELPGILRWAMAGWTRLRERGRFLQPATSEEAIEEIADLTSPVSAFVRDAIEVGKGKTVSADRLFEAWQKWCKEQGRDSHGTLQMFAKDFRSAMPDVHKVRHRPDFKAWYEGIDVKLSTEVP